VINKIEDFSDVYNFKSELFMLPRHLN